MKIGILTAMESERAQIAALLDERQEASGKFSYTCGRLQNNEIVLHQCGIGKVNAAVGTAELIRTYQPDCVISTGVAGGIDTRLNVMDVVVSDRNVHHDFDLTEGWGCLRGEIQGTGRFFPSGARLVETARSLNNPHIHVGLICTGDQFITSREDLQAIKGYFPDGLAVDMETAAIAQTCHIYGVPFVSFRIISDTPGADAHVQQYENFWTDMADKSFGVTRDFLTRLGEQPHAAAHRSRRPITD